MIRHISARSYEGTIRDVFARKEGDDKLGMLSIIESLEHDDEVEYWAAEGHGHLLLARCDEERKFIVSVVHGNWKMFTIIARAKQPLSFVSRPGDVKFTDLNVAESVELIHDLFMAQNWEST